jgi:gliding motility-associated-like protein
MEGKDSIKELFSQRLGNHEVQVNPELWSSIASQIPAATTTVSSAAGIGLASKILIGISVAASLATGIYFIQSDAKQPIQEQPRQDTLPVELKKNDNPIDLEENSRIETKNSVIDNSDQIKGFENEIISENINVKANEYPLLENESGLVLTEDKSGIKTISQEENKINTEVNAQVENNYQVVENKIENSVTSISETTIQSNQNNSARIPKESSISISLPNIFTPNGDGTNDYLEIKTADIFEFSVVVLDNNGKVVYQSQDVDFKWDGHLQNGDKAPQATYVYYITGKDADGKLVSKHSRLTIKY